MDVTGCVTSYRLPRLPDEFRHDDGIGRDRRFQLRDIRDERIAASNDKVDGLGMG